MTLRALFVQFAISVAASVATVAVVKVIEERQRKRFAPVAPGYGEV